MHFCLTGINREALHIARCCRVRGDGSTAVDGLRERGRHLEEQRQVLSFVTQTVNAVHDTTLRGDTNSAALAHYSQGKALMSAPKWIRAWLDEDLTWTECTRSFDPKVKVADSDTAAVVYCVDESKAYNKNRKFGTVDKSPSDENLYVTYSTQLKKISKGIWQTTEVLSKRGTGRARPAPRHNPLSASPSGYRHHRCTPENRNPSHHGAGRPGAAVPSTVT
ncbi:hypothetical protein ACH4LS_23180 [Streptomyces luteogriseus]|uniref:hypothetical protein n=1 Tax=Streptomyces luteogriseus TaxID=68233 RepID=UPI00379DFF51